MYLFTKQTSETYPVEVDFSDVLATGEIIYMHTVDAYVGDADATADVIDSSTIDGSSIMVQVKDGTDRRRYKITVEITTSDANVFEEDIFMDVWNI